MLQRGCATRNPANSALDPLCDLIQKLLRIKWRSVVDNFPCAEWPTILWIGRGRRILFFWLFLFLAFLLLFILQCFLRLRLFLQELLGLLLMLLLDLLFFGSIRLLLRDFRVLLLLLLLDGLALLQLLRAELFLLLLLLGVQFGVCRR